MYVWDLGETCLADVWRVQKYKGKICGSGGTGADLEDGDVEGRECGCFPDGGCGDGEIVYCWSGGGTYGEEGEVVRGIYLS